MNEKKAIVSIENISKTYANQQESLTVLNQVSIEIQPATFTAIVGPSGSGKSTLLHIMGLLDSPSKGDMAFKGQAINTIPARVKARLRNEHIGFIFQSYHLLAELTALENILLPALLRKNTVGYGSGKSQNTLRTCSSDQS